MTKRATLPIRLSCSSKKMIEDAAAFLGISTSAFIVHNAFIAAKEILQDKNHLILSESDWQLFNGSMSAPLPPNQALCDLMNNEDV